MSGMTDESEIDDLTLPNKDGIVRLPVHYVDNKRLNRELTAWKDAVVAAREAGQEVPRIPEYVGECIWKIGEGLAKKPKFSGYSYREDMVADGCLVCCSYMENYNPHAKTRTGKPNAFSYITRIMYYAFTSRIMSEKQQAYYKYKSLELMGGRDALAGEDMTEAGGNEIVDNILAKAYGFEERRKAKLEASRAKDAAQAAVVKVGISSPFEEFWS